MYRKQAFALRIVGGLAAVLLALPSISTANEGQALERLAWLAGCWRGGAGERVTEECWLRPAGGMMLGLHRDSRGDRGSFEFLRIAEHDGRLAYLASPGGRPPTPFWLKEQTARRVVFENPEHDFPQRIIYWLDDKGTLHGRIEGREDGQDKGLDWSFTAVGSAWSPELNED